MASSVSRANEVVQLPVRVIPFSQEQCSFDKKRVHTWQEWHLFRNRVLDILSRYGTVGPLGKLPILDNYEQSKNEWQLGSPEPDLLVVDDDIYGNSVCVEANCVLVKPPIFQDLLTLLEPLHDWSVYLALKKGELWIFCDRILFVGNFFENCCSVADLYHRCALRVHVRRRKRKKSR